MRRAGAPVHGGVLSALVDMAIGGALGTTHDNAAGGVGQLLCQWASHIGATLIGTGDLASRLGRPDLVRADGRHVFAKEG